MSKKVLKFNKWFYKPILDEERVIIIRTEHYGLCKDDEVILKFIDINKKIEAIIDNVERVRYSALNKGYARRAGYWHVDLLKKELNEMSGIDYSQDDVLYVISFTIKGNLSDRVEEEVLEAYNKMKKIEVVK